MDNLGLKHLIVGPFDFYLLCSQNDLFVVEGASLDWGIVSFGVPGDEE